MQWVFSDPYAVTIAHRILISLATSLLVLAVLRRFLTPGIAWTLAIWWTVLPINYDNLYEIHLFALDLGLVAVLLAFAWTGEKMRAGVFGVLLLDTVFLRSETVIALAVWTAAWIVYEIRLRRRGEGAPVGELLRAFGIPVLVVTLIGLVLFAADPQRSLVVGRIEHRNKINTCGVYALGYEQRNFDYHRSPFGGCGALAKRTFGKANPTLAEAIVANPGAMAGHFLWNLRLAPYGLELALFDGISGGPNRNPDYIEMHYQSNITAVGLLAVIAFVLGGLVLLWRDRRRWWESWIGKRAWGWVALISLAVMALTLLVWQRPRPGYIFGLTLLVLVLVGMAAMAYADRWPRLKGLRAALPPLALLLLIVLPPHYSSGYQTPLTGRPGRPVRDMVERLYPMRGELRGKREHVLATYSAPSCLYLGGENPCKAINWKLILNRPKGVTALQKINERGVDFIYTDDLDVETPGIPRAVVAALRSGWRPVAHGSEGEGWLLLERPRPGARNGS